MNNGWDKFRHMYFSFDGRINRAKYWGFSLWLLPLLLLAIIVQVMAAGNMGSFQFLFSIVIMLPSLALQVKRAHDRNRSGWFVLVGFIPFVGLWPMVEFAFLKGTSGPNKYGADPLLEVEMKGEIT